MEKSTTSPPPIPTNEKKTFGSKQYQMRVHIINDRETGRSRGFGFVTFKDEQSMRDAIEAMNGQSLDGHDITVNEAHVRSSTPKLTLKSLPSRRDRRYGYSSLLKPLRFNALQNPSHILLPLKKSSYHITRCLHFTEEMSYAAYKLMHPPTGIDNCASGFITHSPADSASRILSVQTEDIDSVFSATPSPAVGPIPNLIVTAANVLEVYTVRVLEDGSNTGKDSAAVAQPLRGGLMAGLSGASLELVCSYRLHGNVESVGVLSSGAEDRTSGRRRDSIILTFRDAKISVLEFDDSVYGLRTSSMHCFEGPQWLHLKKGRENFARGPLIKADPLGRCAGVLVYGLQMIMLKAAEAGGLVGDDGGSGGGGSVSARIESSNMISLRDLDVKHVKDFIFVHGYIEPVLVILHEKELTWAGRLPYKHHTCVISALSISTTSKQHPLIWSATNLPHDAYKLLAVPSPIGGVLVVCANTIHYHSQSASCILALNNYAVPVDSSQEMSRSSFSVELDAANATWLSDDVAMLSTKSGELLLLTLVHDGRIVQKLDLSKSKASVLTSGITTVGSSFFFLGSRLGDSLLVQFHCGAGSSMGAKEEVGDIEGDLPSAKRLRRSSSDALQDMANDDELSLYAVLAMGRMVLSACFSDLFVQKLSPNYDMLPFEHQHEIANQIGTTRSQIISNLNDLALGGTIVKLTSDRPVKHTRYGFQKARPRFRIAPHGELRWEVSAEGHEEKEV
ncbi:hypothetical protein SSX86_017108 [Deinandra increscens subsp. villosa]|uniref:RRM domain-containing protein n=1 Tax=Deinandra increscens subsp. villosa TaxID=3103831 RepID=A0AAP0GTZ1_9ASTR